jgi:hypothetical protein
VTVSFSKTTSIGKQPPCRDAENFRVYILQRQRRSTLTGSLGQRPRIYATKKSQALKARFIFGIRSTPARLKRAFSACLHGDLNPWGAAPG